MSFIWNSNWIGRPLVLFAKPDNPTSVPRLALERNSSFCVGFMERSTKSQLPCWKDHVGKDIEGAPRKTKQRTWRGLPPSSAMQSTLPRLQGYDRSHLRMVQTRTAFGGMLPCKPSLHQGTQKPAAEPRLKSWPTESQTIMKWLLSLATVLWGGSQCSSRSPEQSWRRVRGNGSQGEVSQSLKSHDDTQRLWDVRRYTILTAHQLQYLIYSPPAFTLAFWTEVDSSLISFLKASLKHTNNSKEYFSIFTSIGLPFHCMVLFKKQIRIACLWSISSCWFIC